jgi:hypothetical protein
MDLRYTYPVRNICCCCCCLGIALAAFFCPVAVAPQRPTATITLLLQGRGAAIGVVVHSDQGLVPAASRLLCMFSWRVSTCQIQNMSSRCAISWTSCSGVAEQLVLACTSDKRGGYIKNGECRGESEGHVIRVAHGELQPRTRLAPQ